MQLPQPFDARTVDPTQGGGGLPPSDAMGHLVVISKSEVKPTSAGDSGMLELTLQIIDQNSPHRGKEGAYRLNLYNKSQKAVEIAYKQLSALCHVTGQYVVQQSEQLHNIPFRAIVGPQTDQPQYTEVKKVLDASGNEPGKQGQPANAPQPSQPGTWGGQQQPTQAAGTWGGAQPTQGAQAAPASQPAPAWGGNGQATPQSAPQGGQWGQPANTGNGQQPAPGNAAWGGGQPTGAAPQQPAGTPPWGGQASGSAGSPPWGGQASGSAGSPPWGGQR